MKVPQEKILTEMKRTGIIPVFYYPEVAIAREVVESCYKGGVRVFEFTNRGENAFEVFAELLQFVRQFPDLILGIGTIMNAKDAEKFIDAGAEFVVSPILKTEMAIACAKHDILWIPGCGTLTEIVTAKEAGARLIKVFPGAVLGPKFISAALAVVPDLKLMPTGGVEPTQENLKSWFGAGAYCVGMGSQLLTNEIVAARQWSVLEKKVSQLFFMNYR